MREISEYTLLGNYLVIVSDKLGIDTIKYETAKVITEQAISEVNKKSQSYLLLPMSKKMDIVKAMIGKGVFRTDTANKTQPFKQVYTYEVAKNIQAHYSCDGCLVFKLPKQKTADGDVILPAAKETYTSSINLDLKTAINNSILNFKSLLKQPKIKIKEK